MKSKQQKKQIISDVFSQIQKDSTTIHSTHELKIYQNFLNATEILHGSLEKQYVSKTTRPWDISYTKSLFHFFLYYMPAPNYSFILKIHDVVWFAAFTGNHYSNLMISSPTTTTESKLLNSLHLLFNNPHFKSLLKTTEIETILLRDIDHKMINLLRKKPTIGPYHIQNSKQIHYFTYDIKKTLRLQGASYANLRWHLNAFEHANHTIKVVPIQKAKKTVRHLIGQWRKDALSKRGFSFVDTRSDKQGINLATQKKEQTTSHNESNQLLSIETIQSRVLQVDGKIASFNLGYPLGIYQSHPTFAHAIGITDISIPHLAEYAQIDFWKHLAQQGFRYINDGPSWRNSLENYKNKFRPINKKDYYWTTLTT